ncbi:ketopantoate reductase family protein [Quadrisphaera sp. DSM 44207]|uniref:ketopantoate reductase family protein n=1 Tax=Quadrisphaera sp. DSM 44207 TaxID=1881057 RepID=UPI001C40A5FE|nr:2-dehydropantoate 2-reductase [Quadrisphaera sp. DSM 44207]
MSAGRVGAAAGGALLRVAVLGPGGVGGLLAALLAGDGHEVVCLAGAGTASALREHGVRLTSARFGDRAQPVAAAEVLDRPVDACLVAVKATSLQAALQRVPAPVLDGALLVPLLNGVEHVAVLRERYPAATVAPAAIRVESTRTAPGQVHHASPFASLDLTAAPGVERLARALGSAGLDVRVREGEAAVLWDKLAFLAPLALLTTHAAAPAGEVRQRRREDLVAVVEEVAAVARAEGGAGDAAGVLRTFDALPATTRSSMQRDAEAGRPLELDALGGAVLRAAARHGLAAPVTARLVADLERR